MSCHLTLTRPSDEARLQAVGEAAPTFVELARAGRREDFGWLAASHGLTPAQAEELWQAIGRLLHLTP